MDTRAAAGRVIGQVLAGQSLNSALPTMLQRVAPRDRALLQQLCYGSLRCYPRLQATLEQLLTKPLREKDRDLQGLLLAGLYQISATRIPQHAAVAATVAATRALKKDWAKGLVNAVLRRYLREAEALCANLPEAAAVAHPEWLHRQLHRQWPQQAATIIQANNEQPPMTLRTNVRLSNREADLEALAAAGIAARAGKLGEHGICLQQACDVQQLPGFDQGRLSVQDEAAQLAAPLLAAAAGERVLDACAAPGGKSCHILELQPDLAEFIAMDVSAERLARVAENMSRLGLQATLLEADAASPPATLDAASFDRILVDAPCSATGVIRRHPDIKLLRREEDIDQFARQQLDILNGVWPLLQIGGTLLYVTCSVLEQENSAVVAKFIEANQDASCEMPQVAWGVEMPYGRQLLPQPDGPDGLFFSRLLKNPPRELGYTSP